MILHKTGRAGKNIGTTNSQRSGRLIQASINPFLRTVQINPSYYTTGSLMEVCSRPNHVQPILPVGVDKLMINYPLADIERFKRHARDCDSYPHRDNKFKPRGRDATIWRHTFILFIAGIYHVPLVTKWPGEGGIPATRHDSLIQSRRSSSAQRKCVL